jgi:DNA-binding GntR family transcriptional regulator
MQDIKHRFLREVNLASVPAHFTKSELALRVLRERIRSGELRAGERIQVDEIARELGMSQTPVREALRLLQADRLVDYEPHRGAIIAELDGETIAEIFRLRCLLEPLAVELAVPKLAGDALAQLEGRHAEFVASATSASVPNVAELNQAWHWALYESSRSVFLMDFIRRLWESFPWRTVRLLPSASSETSAAQHEAVMEAIRAHDAQAAGRSMLAHIRRTEHALLEQVAPNPGTDASTG